MRVLAIRGRNLASLEGEFSIDFTEEPLASAGIFAISGPTGAGKSTLLDAMCLALFSRTPRTELAKENNVRLRDVQEEVLPQSDPRFLLRRGTASGYAEVDFVALNGCRYRARWSVSRAREKESGRLQAARLTLYNIDAGKEEPGTNKDLQARIIELIGLTFDQFTRSVLLAQNDFSTFLKAEQGEKASLLEKLTGTEQYSEISRRIFAKNTEAKEAYEQLYARVQGIELLSEEEVEASQTRLSALEVELARLEKAKVERQSLREAVKAAEVQIASKEKQREENARFLERALASLETSRKEYEQGEVRLARTDEESKSLRLELQQARKLDVQLESALKARSEADERMKDFSRRKQEAEEKLRKVEERQKKASEEWDKQTSWRERYRSKEGIAEQLSALLIHLNTCLTPGGRAVGQGLASHPAENPAVGGSEAILAAGSGDARQGTGKDRGRAEVRIACPQGIGTGGFGLVDRDLPYGTGAFIAGASPVRDDWRYQKPAGQADRRNALSGLRKP